jgi:hypothetical protein
MTRGLTDIEGRKVRDANELKKRAAIAGLHRASETVCLDAATCNQIAWTLVGGSASVCGHWPLQEGSVKGNTRYQQQEGHRKEPTTHRHCPVRRGHGRVDKPFGLRPSRIRAFGFPAPGPPPEDNPRHTTPASIHGCVNRVRPGRSTRGQSIEHLPAHPPTVPTAPPEAVEPNPPLAPALLLLQLLQPCLLFGACAGSRETRRPDSDPSPCEREREGSNPRPPKSSTLIPAAYGCLSEQSVTSIVLGSIITSRTSMPEYVPGSEVGIDGILKKVSYSAVTPKQNNHVPDTHRPRE